MMWCVSGEITADGTPPSRRRVDVSAGSVINVLPETTGMIHSWESNYSISSQQLSLNDSPTAAHPKAWYS